MTVIPMTKRVMETFEKPTYSVQIVLQSYNAEVTVCNIQGSKDYLPPWKHKKWKIDAKRNTNYRSSIQVSPMSPALPHSARLSPVRSRPPEGQSLLRALPPVQILRPAGGPRPGKRSVWSIVIIRGCDGPLRSILHMYCVSLPYSIHCKIIYIFLYRMFIIIM